MGFDVYLNISACVDYRFKRYIVGPTHFHSRIRYKKRVACKIDGGYQIRLDSSRMIRKLRREEVRKFHPVLA